MIIKRKWSLSERHKQELLNSKCKIGMVLKFNEKSRLYKKENNLELLILRIIISKNLNLRLPYEITYLKFLTLNRN